MSHPARRPLTHCKVWIDLGETSIMPEGAAPYTVWFDYSPGCPGVHTLPNGDPGYPDEPETLELNEIERLNVTFPITVLTDEQVDFVEQRVRDFIAEQESDDDNES